MSIGVETLDDPERWNALLSRSSSSSPFHRYEFLEVCADHADASLHPLVGYKGQEPVGLFPMFTLRKGPLTIASSPAPRLTVPYGGPTLLFAGDPKRRRREKQQRRFVESCIDWVDRQLNPSFTNIRTAVGYSDIRPFMWRDFDVTPRHTYVVDLTVGADELLSRFSSDARRNVRREYDVDVEVIEGGHETIQRIVDHIDSRHEEQNREYPVTAAFVRDLYDRLPDGVIRPYGCRVDGEFASGIVDVEFDGRGHNWIGGGKPDCDLPVNDLLDWRLFRDGMERGLDSHDMVGANNARLSTFKAKFGPELMPYYEVNRGTKTARIASALYNRFR